jgi:O-antigen ligase
MKRLLLFLLLCVMFLATTFGWDLSLAPGLSVKNAFLYTIIVIYMIETAVFHNRQLDLPAVLVPFGLFVGYCILSWFVAAYVVQLTNYPTIETAFSLKTNGFDHLMFFLLFFYGLSSTQDVLGLLRTFLWILVIGNLITVIDGFNIPDLGIIQQREDGRLGGPMGESNAYGVLLALTLPAIIALLWDPQTKRLYAYFAILVSIVALLLASSRGAFIALIIGSLFSIYYLRAYVSMRQVAVGTIVLLATVTLIIMAFLSTDLVGDLVQRFMDKLSGSSREISSGRTKVWTMALQQMSEQPLSFFTGFGWDAYKHINRSGFNTHNVYLNHLFNLGLPGLTLYCLLIYKLISSCRRAISKATGTLRNQLIAFIFGFASLSIALFFVQMYQAWIWVWAYTGLMMRLAVASSQPTEDEADKIVDALSVSTAK